METLITTDPEKESLDLAIEGMMRRGSFVGDGKDGIVMRVNVGNLEKKAVGIESEDGESAEEYALKILKIFKKGEGKKEYDIQMRAYSLLSKDPAKFAQAPKPILVHTQHLNKVDKDFLGTYGAMLDDDAEIILMDYIDGKDLVIYVYDFFLSKHNFTEQVIENMSIEEKFEHVARLMNFEFTTAEGDFEEAISLRDNARKFDTHLRKLGFKLGDKILEKLEASINELEKNRIFHNDLRERNVMIDREGNPYIIDFGRAVSNKDDQIFDDMAVVRRYRDIGVSDEKKESFGKSVEINRWKNPPKKIEMVKKVSILLDNNNVARIQNLVLGSLSNESELDNILTALFASINDSNGNRETRLNSVLEALNQLMKGKLTPFTLNKLKRFIKFLEQ